MCGPVAGFPLRARYVRIDSIEHAIRNAHGPAGELGDLGYRVGYAIAQDNLRAGRSVVADSENPILEVGTRGVP